MGSRNLILIVAVTLLSLTKLHAQIGTESGDSVLNSFLATYAKDEPSWKKDIQFTNTPKVIPAGKEVGYSPIIGWFTYKPKLWDDLTDTEKAQIFTDVRLKAFIISLRQADNTPPSTAQANDPLMPPPVPLPSIKPAEEVKPPLAPPPEPIKIVKETKPKKPKVIVTKDKPLEVTPSQVLGTETLELK